MRRALLAGLVVLHLAAGGLVAAADHAKAPTASPDERYALIVGVSDYRGRVEDTVGGAGDARLVRDLLVEQGWRADRIRLLVDDDATADAIADGLSWLASTSSPRTFSLFHYSGHVKQKGGAEHLWPVDNGFLRDTDVARVLRSLRGTAWTSISGCEAGGFDEGISSDRHLFTGSSTVTEKSYEDPRTGLSVWSGLLFDRALRDGAADGDGDGGVSVQEAVRWAAPHASAYTRNQRPHGPQHPVRAGSSGSLRLDAPRTLQ